jgi:SAM-dependent methyltransferase
MKNNEFDYLSINKELWNNRVEDHYSSEFYNVRDFINGKTSLNQIELDILGNIDGKRILHLQCHFGQDSISLARLGANVTAVDISDKAIEKGKELAEICNVKVNFICCDIYSLPDINKWSEIVSHFLKKDGHFIFVDFHPFIWMYDDDFSAVTYNYFNDQPIIVNNTGSYASPESPVTANEIGWNHSLSDVIMSLKKKGIELINFKEYDYSPYNCFQGMIELKKGKFVIEKFQNKVPMVYSLHATKI